jgi:hypothetical protein
MIEGVLSTIVVAVMMVAAVRVVAASRVVQFKNAARAQGTLLAESILVEIFSKPYEDATSPIIGRESGESGSSRDSLDDVDDYHGWNEKPIKESDGTGMEGLNGEWGCTVTVERVAAADVSGAAALLETGAKRVTVKITLKGVPIVTAVAVRTRAR